MRVFTNRQFKGHYPVGVAAVVVAADEVEAAEQLNRALEARGLPQTANRTQFEEVDTSVRCALILVDGNY